MSKIKNTLYVSTAARKYTKEELHDYLRQFRRNNVAVGVTGILIYQEGTFLQFIEGDENIVDSLVQKIADDERHNDLITLRDQITDKRLFPDWSMGFREMTAIDELPDYYDFVNRRLEGTEENEGEFAYRFIRSFADNFFKS